MSPVRMTTTTDRDEVEVDNSDYEVNDGNDDGHDEIDRQQDQETQDDGRSRSPTLPSHTSHLASYAVMWASSNDGLTPHHLTALEWCHHLTTFIRLAMFPPPFYGTQLALLPRHPTALDRHCCPSILPQSIAISPQSIAANASAI